VPVLTLCHGPRQNFIANAAEAQLNGTLLDDSGNITPPGLVLRRLDVFFTTIFTFEVVVSLYAYWLSAFLSDGW
jgi:hypothetical protein